MEHNYHRRRYKSSCGPKSQTNIVWASPKCRKKSKTELRKIEDCWQTGTTWKFRAIKLLSEKPAFLHTSCRIAIDLRKSQAESTLQSTDFPPAPVPTVTIADRLQLKQMQRSDLMAIPAEIIDERQSGTEMRIALGGRKQGDPNRLY